MKDSVIQLRDQIAIAAMQAIIKNPKLDASYSNERITKEAYEMADDMLKARMDTSKLDIAVCDHCGELINLDVVVKEPK